MSKSHKIKLVQPDSGMSCDLEVSLAPVNVTVEPWDNSIDISGIAEKFLGKDTAYKADKLAEGMTLKDGILKMPKEDNNTKHDGGYDPIEYEIDLTTDTDYVPIKITWKGQYPTIRKKNLEDNWEEVYDLVQVGIDILPGDEYYYKQIGSTVGKVRVTNLRNGKEISKDVFKYAHNVTEFFHTFGGSSITFIPEGLFDNCPKVTSFNSTFSNCTSLTYIPEGLFDNCPNVTSFHSTFYVCDRLTGSTPTVTTKDGNRYKLWELAGKPGYPEEIDGTECFFRCDKLYDYKKIPEDWR